MIFIVLYLIIIIVSYPIYFMIGWKDKLPFLDVIGYSAFFSLLWWLYPILIAFDKIKEWADNIDKKRGI